MAAIEIRRATQEDLPVLVLYGKAFHTESPRFKALEYDPIHMYLQIENALTDPMLGVFVAVENGQIIGGIIGEAYKSWFGHDLISQDQGIYLHPNRRNGFLLKRLVDTYVEWARSIGVKDITLGIFSEVHPERTVKLFERWGFTQSGWGYRLK